ncbi:DUF6161 domain-containing protein [Flavobacterium sp. AS60]|uniref:DUF6161 domain-containing protein n=1 Tax=Flavobacterium anseongense TaxID=2910677 RepID=UPI001F4423A5|nr:DUF6161 domain-containing protein [Flavobacterium sp. AS60]MCF6128806.1 DUF6161 domain-containing protein [Flavobacterium sp. AS60]
MNASELNRFVKLNAGSEIKDLQFNLVFPISNFNNSFGLNTLYKFCTAQVKAWDSFESLPAELLESRNYFATIKERIEQLVEDVKVGQDSAHYINELNAAISRRSNRMLPGDSPEAPFLVSVFKESTEQFAAAYSFLLGNVNYSSFSNAKYVQGVLVAALHKLNDSPIINRTSHERSSFNSLKSRVEKYVSESDEDLKTLFQEGEKRMNETTKELETIKIDSQKKLDKWFALNQSTAKNFTNEVNEERKNIERTYKELLQLQAPAQHWKDSSEKLLDEGHMFMRALFALLVIGGFALYFLLWKTPEGMLASFFNGDKASAIRWSIVFVTFISLLFVGIQALRKAMFSSFHLARDAQEREKLTMYYLSLIKEGAVANEDKILILQSLFSRADSGLLKEDSSPTMPGIIDKLRPN